MALWYKLKRIANQTKTKARQAIRSISSQRPTILSPAFIKNTVTVLLSLVYKTERLKSALCKQTQMISEMQIPRFLRKIIFLAYSKFYKVNLSEIELPLNQYQTFSSFFTRKITRPLPALQPCTVSSPCDGKVLVIQQVTGDKCQIIKNCKYSLSELVSGKQQTESNTYIEETLKINKRSKLFQLVIYLAPGDYHRFHSPTDLKIIKRTPIDGDCDPVNERTILKGKPIYEKNGRMSLISQWKEGLMTMVMVGALNVMRIHITDNNQLARGDNLGYFNLGSTIVMIVEVKDLSEWKVQPGSTVRVGEPLLEYIPYA